MTDANHCRVAGAGCSGARVLLLAIFSFQSGQRLKILSAVIATGLATLIALSAAMVLMRAKALRHRRLTETVVDLPLLLPEIVVAVAVLILFSRVGLTNGTLRLVLAHTAFCTPFAFLPIRARLQGMGTDCEEAAQDSLP